VEEAFGVITVTLTNLQQLPYPLTADKREPQARICLLLHGSQKICPSR
jgi:hypothetical protein